MPPWTLLSRERVSQISNSNSFGTNFSLVTSLCDSVSTPGARPPPHTHVYRVAYPSPHRRFHIPSVGSWRPPQRPPQTELADESGVVQLSPDLCGTCVSLRNLRQHPTAADFRTKYEKSVAHVPNCVPNLRGSLRSPRFRSRASRFLTHKAAANSRIYTKIRMRAQVPWIRTEVRTFRAKLDNLRPQPIMYPQRNISRYWPSWSFPCLLFLLLGLVARGPHPPMFVWLKNCCCSCVFLSRSWARLRMAENHIGK